MSCSLKLLSNAQSPGLSLLEIKELTSTTKASYSDHVEVKLKDKIVTITQQIEQLQILKLELEGLLAGNCSEIPKKYNLPDNSKQTALVKIVVDISETTDADISFVF